MVLCCLQVSVLEEISRGEVLLAVARRCLKLMQDFVGAQIVLADPLAAAAAVAGGDPAAAAAAAGVPKPQDIGFEMVCALVNNSVDCYNQSVEFTEHVQVGVRRTAVQQSPSESFNRCLHASAMLTCQHALRSAALLVPSHARESFGRQNPVGKHPVMPAAHEDVDWCSALQQHAYSSSAVMSTYY